MKVIKGQPGYLSGKKKQDLIKTILEFAVVIALLVIGYVTTGTRKNLLTVVAILGCLPAAKALVGVITLYPYRSIDAIKGTEVEEKTGYLQKSYDMVITTYRKNIPIDCIVVSPHMICGYLPHEKADLRFAETYLKQILSQNGFGSPTVKLFAEYPAFLSRVEGMNNIAAVEKQEDHKREEQICGLFLSRSV